MMSNPNNPSLSPALELLTPNRGKMWMYICAQTNRRWTVDLSQQAKPGTSTSKTEGLLVCFCHVSVKPWRQLLILLSDVSIFSQEAKPEWDWGQVHSAPTPRCVQGHHGHDTGRRGDRKSKLNIWNSYWKPVRGWRRLRCTNRPNMCCTGWQRESVWTVVM